MERIVAVRAVLGVMLAGVMLAACGGSTTGGGTAETEAPAVATDAPGAMTQAPEVTDAAGGVAGSTTGGETQITQSGVVVPKQFGTATYAPNEYRDDQLAMLLPFKADDLDAVLEAQGKTRADTLLVVVPPSDMAYPTVTAVRIDGGEGLPLANAVANGSFGELTWTTEDIGGKSVKVAKGTQGTIVLYAAGDTMYEVTGTDKAQLEAMVGMLP